MSESRFWKFINNIDTTENWLWEYKEEKLKAAKLLLAEIPEARKWRRWEEDERPLILDLLFALAWRSFDTKSPKRMKYQPQDITIHLSEEEFENILFQKPPRGAITFMWNIFDEDGFTRPSNNERLVTFLYDYHHDGDEITNENITGAVLGFIKGKCLELYAFPQTWFSIIEQVHHEIGKMTAVEKAGKEISHELKAFVDLLGWDVVNTKLQKLKP